MGFDLSEIAHLSIFVNFNFFLCNLSMKCLHHACSGTSARKWVVALRLTSVPWTSQAIILCPCSTSSHFVFVVSFTPTHFEHFEALKFVRFYIFYPHYTNYALFCTCGKIRHPYHGNVGDKFKDQMMHLWECTLERYKARQAWRMLGQGQAKTSHCGLAILRCTKYKMHT